MNLSEKETMSKQKELSVDKFAAIFLMVVAFLFIESCVTAPDNPDYYERQNNETETLTRKEK